MSLEQIVELEGHIQSIYLAIYDDKLMVLDGCCRPDVQMVLDYITHTLKRPISDLKLVIVTHMHPDHAGGALLFKQKTGCQIVAANTRQQWYRGMRGRTNHVIDVALAAYVAKRLGKPFKNLWYPRHLNPDIKVSDGDAVPGFEDWRVVSTPGHTDRDISVYHPQTGVIYTADLIIKLRHKFVRPVPVTLPVVYQQSLKKVKALSPNKVMMAHGGQRYIEPEVFDSLINNAPKKLDSFKRMVRFKLFKWQRKTTG